MASETLCMIEVVVIVLACLSFALFFATICLLAHETFIMRKALFPWLTKP